MDIVGFRQVLVLITLLGPITTWADGRVRVDLQGFTDATKPTNCNVIRWWGDDLLTVMRERMVETLRNSESVQVVEAERALAYQPSFDSNVEMIHKTGRLKNSQFSIRSTVQTLDFCAKTPAALNAQVGIEVVILDVQSGETVEKFLSQASVDETPVRDIASLKTVQLGSGLFLDSPIGRALTGALADATERISRHFPKADVAPDAYKVKTLPASKGS